MAPRGRDRRGRRSARRKPIDRALDLGSSCGDVPGRGRTDAGRCRAGAARARRIERLAADGASAPRSRAAAPRRGRSRRREPGRSAEEAESFGATDILVVALAERSLLADAGDEAEGEALAARARALLDDGALREHLLSAIAFAASARQGLRHGDLQRARADLARAHALASRLTHALPWYAVQTDVELGHADVALLDAPRRGRGSQPPPRSSDSRPRLGILAGRVDALRAELARVEALGEDRATVLTSRATASPLRTTHLLPRDRGATLRLAEHGEDAGDLDLPEARRLQQERGDRTGGRARPRLGTGSGRVRPRSPTRVM